MIELAGITKIYNGTQSVQALKGIDLKVPAGEIYGIIGKSGAGKSTLIRCINMLERPTAGTVLVDGEDMTGLSEQQLQQKRKKIGMIFQHFNLLSSRTVYDNVAFPLELAGKSRQEIRDEVLPLLELVGLTEWKDQYPAQLSGGQKQRVGIARALANKPKVLLCDEATSALDPQTTQSILRLLRDINKKLALTIVLITHEMQVIKEICDRVGVIEDGLIIEQGAVLELFTRPRTATAREFIRTIVSHDLPDRFRNIRFSSQPASGGSMVLRISFVGEVASEPVISRVSRDCQVDTNILFGNIDTIQDTPFGTLILEISGEPAALDRALQYLRVRELGVEVIGYAAGNRQAAG
ncbi:MAG TPA: methionine ABC transporter ATP-binding protein [Patescibacteria group bacterium]|nr:methionine ABC transporter ATP-binding protein [Patescibacteria group bacterium]